MQKLSLTDQQENLRQVSSGGHNQNGLRYQDLVGKGIEIIDFSPDWDYTTGGAKLLICIEPQLEAHGGLIENMIKVGFDDVLVPIKFISPGVFRCNAPAHPAGYVTLNLFFGDQQLTFGKRSHNSFEYKRKNPSKSKKRVKVKQRDDMAGDMTQNKIRIVEKLMTIE
jgi:hypothetical protein